MRQVELHRNGINAHYPTRTYYALHSETREQITEEYGNWHTFLDALYKMGYTAKDFIRCW